MGCSGSPWTLGICVPRTSVSTGSLALACVACGRCPPSRPASPGHCGRALWVKMQRTDSAGGWEGGLHTGKATLLAPLARPGPHFIFLTNPQDPSPLLPFQGLKFEVVPSQFKETLRKASFSTPSAYAVETAKQKALEVAHRMYQARAFTSAALGPLAARGLQVSDRRTMSN